MQSIKYITVWVLILILAIFTPGISLYKRLCVCNATQNISFLPNAQPCRKSQNPTSFDACQHDVKSVSVLHSRNIDQKNDKLTFSSEHSFSNDKSCNCCQEEVVTLKLSEQYETRFELKISFQLLIQFILPTVLSFFQEDVYILCSKKSSLQSYSIPPLPYSYGYSLCIAQCRLLN